MTAEFLLTMIATFAFCGVGCVVWAIWNQRVYEKNLLLLIDELYDVKSMLTRIHIDLNGKSEQLLRVTRELARKQGIEEGILGEKTRAAESRG